MQHVLHSGGIGEVAAVAATPLFVPVGLILLVVLLLPSLGAATEPAR